MRISFKLKINRWPLTAISSALLVHATHAVEALPSVVPHSATACVGLISDRERLSCYDALFKANSQISEDQAPLQAERLAPAPESQALSVPEKIKAKVQQHALFGPAPSFNPNSSLLDQRWELSEESSLGTWQIRPFQPIYMLPAFWTSNKNSSPSSPNPNNTSSEAKSLKSTEAKFQLSLKTKAWDDIFGDNGDLWIGYTQSSRWQVYNGADSRPFRETNYEPEASLVFRTNYNLLGMHGRLLGLTLNHQSNGRSNPLSRSWNRVMLNLGFEKDNFAMVIRPWYRLHEDAESDNNADITHYLGYGDLSLFYRKNKHDFSLMLRNNFKSDNKGAVQFDWVFPLTGNLRGHFQVFDGYGESLIDYNHRATYVGLGISMFNWF
jgi:phospholipase A1